MQALKLVAAVAASLSLGACASTGTAGAPPVMYLAANPGAAPQLAARSSSPSALLHVENFNWMDVVVYAVQGNSRVRLGEVTSMNSANFRLPSRFLAGSDNVRLMVDPIGSTEGYITDGILVHDGDRVSFSVQNALQFSSLMVGSR